MNGIPLSFSCLMPPMVFIVLVFIGTLMGWRWQRLGAIIATPSALLLYACSTPLVSSWLLALSAGATPPAIKPASAAQAIVVLAADVQQGRSPGESDLPGPLTLERIMKAAQLHRSSGLPILVAGGPIPSSPGTFASVISGALRDDFGVQVRWRENQSINTFENAAFSASMLKQDGVSTVLLVAHDWDMARAVWSFDQAGIVAIPAPAGRGSSRPNRLSLVDFLPGATGIQESLYALHELLGLQYYHWYHHP